MNETPVLQKKVQYQRNLLLMVGGGTFNSEKATTSSDLNTISHNIQLNYAKNADMKAICFMINNYT
jgi:hypothetical protein